MNTFTTPTWIYREGLIAYFSRLGANGAFIQKLRDMSDAEVERMNARVCSALAGIDFSDEHNA